MSGTGIELAVLGITVSQDDQGNVCLNDLWALAGKPDNQRAKDWRRYRGTDALMQALTERIVCDTHNSRETTQSAIYYSTGKGQAAKTFAHPVLALAYAEVLNPAIGVEVREIFLRYRANDVSLAQDILEQMTEQQEYDTLRVKLREQVKAHNRLSAGAAKAAGVKNFEAYNGAGLGGLYGGMTKAELLKQWPSSVSRSGPRAPSALAMAHSSSALLGNGVRAAHQRLGFGRPVGGLEQQGQVVEANGDGGMVGVQALVVDDERAAVERLGLGEAVGILQQLGQVVEGGGVFRSVRSVPNLHCLGVALRKRDRLAVLPGPIEFDHTLVESFQLGVRLSAGRTFRHYHGNQQHAWQHSAMKKTVHAHDTTLRAQAAGLWDAAVARRRST